MPGTSPSSEAYSPSEVHRTTRTRRDADEDNVYEVTITANHGPDMATRDVAVTVTNVDELGMISGDVNPSYAENEMGPVATYTASGPDAASRLYGRRRESMPGPSPSPEAYSPSEVHWTTRTRRTPMETTSYKVTVTATYGTDTATRDVTVTVTNVDELGEISGRCRPQLRGERGRTWLRPTRRTARLRPRLNGR